MNEAQARKLCEALGINPDAPVGKKTRAEVVAEVLTQINAENAAPPKN